MQSYRGPVDISHPNFSKDSEAAIRPPGITVPGQAECMDKPVAIGARDIKWTEDDDKKIDEYMRNAIATTWHSVGFCSNVHIIRWIVETRFHE
jgi:alcohol oxidase